MRDDALGDERLGRTTTPSVRGLGAALLTTPIDPDTKKRLELAEWLRRYDEQTRAREWEDYKAAKLLFEQGEGTTKKRTAGAMKILGWRSTYPAKYPGAELLLLAYTDLRRSLDAKEAAEALRVEYGATSVDSVAVALRRAKQKVAGWVREYPHLNDFHQPILDRLPPLPRRP